MKPIKIFLVFLLVSSLFLSSCGPTSSQKGSLPRVIAVETFLQDIAQNVAGDRLKVQSLLPPSVDPHEYQPKPLDVVRLSQAQVLIVNGLGYETWLKKTLDSLDGQRRVIVATEGLSSVVDVPVGAAEQDPHLWMDPANVIGYVEQIRDGLILADPAGKDVYDTNSKKYILQLEALDQWVKDQVVQIPVEKRLPWDTMPAPMASPSLGRSFPA
jgi:ABC-type Zn uptake system ZnuABC Zn-binding protein ZnuA